MQNAKPTENPKPIENTRNVLVLMNDLIFQVKMTDAAKHAGVNITFVKTSDQLLQRAAEEKPELIILDINYALGSPLETIGSLKHSGQTRSIALLGYVSHVQTELRKAAVDAGCDRVVARSTFIQDLVSLLRQES